MRTMVKVRSGFGPGADSDIHEIDGEPEALGEHVNKAIKANDRFVAFEVPKGKKLSVIAKRVEAIWQE